MIAEVIESKVKPSLPFGEICQDACGKITIFRDKPKGMAESFGLAESNDLLPQTQPLRSMQRRAIIALGRQDTSISGLSPNQNLEILGASSDHLILNCKNSDLKVGVGVNFNLDYGSLLMAMTSRFIKKQFIK